jgi:hypothetical protein
MSIAILTYDTVGKERMCFKGLEGQFSGPMLEGTSEAATHSWQNYWGPRMNNAEASARPQRHVARRKYWISIGRRRPGDLLGPGLRVSRPSHILRADPPQKSGLFAIGIL